MIDFITKIDFSVLYFIQEHLRCDFLDYISAGISMIFEAGIFWLLVAVIFLISRKTRVVGVLVLCSLLLFLLVSELGLKNIICRERPCHIDGTIPLAIKMPESFSFPSGHTASSFAAAGTIYAYNKRLGIPALIIALIVGLSRLYLFVHFPTDVLAGIVVGLLCSFVTVSVFRRIRR